MAVTINASTSAGLVNTADTSGVLALQTAGTTAVTVDASQNVGIGTVSPSAPMDVVSNSAAIGTRIRGRSADSYGVLEFTNNSASAETARIAADTSGNIIFSNTGSVTERMRILAGAPILCLSGGSTTATGTGIAFPATQSASSDANTLDDYEEGTWTPTVTPSSGSITAVTVGGQYRKVGGLVSLQFSYQITNNGTGSGIVYVSNLPFANTIGANTSAGIMKEIAVIGYSGVAYFNATNTLFCTTYVSGYPGGASHYWLGSICYYA